MTPNPENAVHAALIKGSEERAILLAKAKHKLVERYRRGQEAPAVHRLPAISRRGAGDSAPLSFNQHQIWLHSQMAPGVPLYNEPVTIHRKGSLDATILVRCVNEIVRRHEILRTTFPMVNGQPVQRVHPHLEFQFPVVDLSGLPADRRDSEALRLATEDAQQPFDLVRGPLLRGRIIQLDPAYHRLCLTLHHLIFDGVSIYRIFLPELIELYKAFSTGAPAQLPELPVQYADFALWQRQVQQQDQVEFSRQMEYWKKQLADPPVLHFSAVSPRPAALTFRGGTLPFSLPRDLSQGLRILSRQEGVTLFMTLLAAFSALLCRYSGQDDVLLGTACAGRKRSETEKVFGLFLNTLVLRIDLSGNPTFRDLLKRVKHTTLTALTHDDVPFHRVVEELHPSRDSSRSPLFQVLFTFEPQAAATDPSWALTPHDAETGAAKFDLSVMLDDSSETIVGRLLYSRDLFDSSAITRMLEHWNVILRDVVAVPGRHLAELPLLTPAERQSLVQWNDTRQPYSRSCINEWFEAQCDRAPDAVALVCGQERVSYRELNNRANQLAHYLRKRGVGPEILVGICIERSVHMLVGVLGVLKAGGAYVPLDPAYPKERLRHILEDAKPPVLLTQRSLLELLPEHSAEVIPMDADWPVIGRESVENPATTIRAENLAYVLFTSGSTGRPKGVALEHRSAAAFIHWAQATFTPQELAGTLFSTSLCFDLSVFEMFVPLSVGGAVILAPNVLFLSSLPAANEVTLINTVPSAIAELVRSHGVPPGVKVVNLAGEALPMALVKEIYESTNVQKVYNLYGPTETTTYSTYTLVAPGEEVTIGRPLSNTQAHVLDANRQPLPVGIPGELYLAGEGLARGYFGRPDLTAERFVPDPFSNQPNARMYKTGDLVRHLPEGKLQFIGRSDRQVKIRGFRIELGEVEAVLAQHPAVREVVVSAPEDRVGNKHLIAHVSPRLTGSLPINELREFLEDRLPGYMVPSDFVFLSSLPRTPNGKVNTRALPSAPRWDSSSDRVTISMPGNSVEARLRKLWQGVLGTNDIDWQDDFFELGGHSLLAMKLLARIEREFGLKLPLLSVFQMPTIEQMADLLRDPQSSPASAELVPIQPMGTMPPLFFIRGGPRFRVLAHRLGLHQPFLGLHLPSSEIKNLAFPYSLEDIASRLVKIMRKAQPQGPYYLGGLCVNGTIAYEMARQLVANGQRVGMLAMFDAHNHTYYDNFSRGGRWYSLLQRLAFNLRNLRRLDVHEIPGFAMDRLTELRRKIQRAVWQTRYGLGLRSGNGQLRNLDPIVQPASWVYRAQPYPGRAVLFQSTHWPQGAYFDLRLGWAGLVTGGLQVYKIEGDHVSMFAEPNVGVVAEKLKQYLREGALA